MRHRRPRSAELSEIRGLADRVLVMYEGRVTAAYDKADADESVLGLAMAGGGADGSDSGTSGTGSDSGAARPVEAGD